MTTSNYMADVVVEIAFSSGYGTPAVDRVWTDVSEYVDLDELITISWGRQNERSQADANQLSLTLDNSDGRFTAERVTSPYYPNVKLDRPIRVKATPVDGSESVRFTGYVNEWPVEWDGTAASAKASITASSRLSRLGYTATLKSIIERAILADSPLAYYTLGEPANATQANDSSGQLAGPLLPVGAGDPVVFGNATGPSTDSLTAAEFSAFAQWLSGGTTSGTFAGVTIEAFALANPAGLAGFVAASLTVLPPGAGDGIYIGFSVTGQVEVGVYVAGAVTAVTGGSANVADGSTHHLAATWDGVTLKGYVDGVLMVSGALAGTPKLGGTSVTFSAARVPMTVAHVAVFGSTLTASQLSAHASAGLTGYAGETTDERLERYADYGNIPSAEIDVEPGSTTMAHVDTTDKQVVELLRVVETTEGGVLYDERDGTLTLHNRAHRYTEALALTLDMGQHMVETGYQPTLERTYIVNDVNAANIGGTVTAHVFDEASVNDDYGPMPATIETASEDPDAPLQAASWMVSAYKQPRVRVASCGVDALAQVDKSPNCAEVLDVTVGSKIAVGGHPQQASYGVVDYFVEGGTEAYGPESLRLTWNLSPTSPWDQTLILGDATRGFLGTNPLAY